MAKYLGKMHIVYAACGHVVAACWVTRNEKDAANFKRRKLKPGQRLETIDRHDGDPFPEWCHQGCCSAAVRHKTAQRENVAREQRGQPCDT